MNDDRSIFEKMGDTQFKKYCRYAINILEKEATRRLSTSDLVYFEKLAWHVMDKLKSPLGRLLSRLDIEYLYETIYLNKDNFSDDSEIIRPSLSIEDVTYTTVEQKEVKTVRTGKVPTYSKDGLDNQSYLFTIWHEYNDIEPWDWKVVDEQALDWEITDEEFEIE
jgi:hypothetical protein